MQRLVTIIMSLLLMPFILPAQQSLQERLDEFGRIGSDWIYGDFDQAQRQAKETNRPIFPSSAECRERRASTSTGRLSVRIQNWLI